MCPPSEMCHAPPNIAEACGGTARNVLGSQDSAEDPERGGRGVSWVLWVFSCCPHLTLASVSPPFHPQVAPETAIDMVSASSPSLSPILSSPVCPQLAFTNQPSKLPHGPLGPPKEILSRLLVPGAVPLCTLKTGRKWTSLPGADASARGSKFFASSPSLSFYICTTTGL